MGESLSQGAYIKSGFGAGLKPFLRVSRGWRVGFPNIASFAWKLPAVPWHPSTCGPGAYRCWWADSAPCPVPCFLKWRWHVSGFLSAHTNRVVFLKDPSVKRGPIKTLRRRLRGFVVPIQELENHHHDDGGTDYFQDLPHQVNTSRVSASPGISLFYKHPEHHTATRS
jgi:hypothetical protein